MVQECWPRLCPDLQPGCQGWGVDLHGVNTPIFPQTSRPHTVLPSALGTAGPAQLHQGLSGPIAAGDISVLSSTSQEQSHKPALGFVICVLLEQVSAGLSSSVFLN